MCTNQLAHHGKFVFHSQKCSRQFFINAFLEVMVTYETLLVFERILKHNAHAQFGEKIFFYFFYGGFLKDDSPDEIVADPTVNESRTLAFWNDPTDQGPLSWLVGSKGPSLGISWLHAASPQAGPIRKAWIL